MKSTPVRYTLFVVSVILLLTMTVSVSARVQSDFTQDAPVKWLTYIDPRFDFSINYPSNWEVIPRDDSDPNALSGTLVFAPTSISDVVTDVDPHEHGPYIVVVPYLAELKDGQPLSGWTEMYEWLGHPEEERPWPEGKTRGGWDYQFTNIAYKNVVWVVWTNVPSSDPSGAVYHQMVQSLKFGWNTPSSLKDVYGDNFVPMDLEIALRLSSENDATAYIEPSAQMENTFVPMKTGLTSTWKSPVTNTTSGPRQANCGSDKHKDPKPGQPANSYSGWAVDIMVPEGTIVTNSKDGTVTFFGWRTDGYGNLVTVKASGGKVATIVVKGV